MNNKMKRTIEFMSVGLIALATNAGVVYACTPVVYVFRHAEDYTPNPKICKTKDDGERVMQEGDNKNCTTNGPYGQLTQTGATRASLYPAMVSNFQTNHKNLTKTLTYPGEEFCPIKAVYATNPSSGSVTNTMNLGGADNAFCTARPLARSLNPTNPAVFPSGIIGDNLFRGMCNDLNDDFSVVHNALSPNDPIVFVKVGADLVGLDEYMGNTVPKSSGEVKPDYETKVAKALRTALVTTAETQGSSAIFWTSQGLHILAGSIIGNASVVPQKKLEEGKVTVTDAINKSTPPRNAVYIFKAANDNKSFLDTPTVDRTQGGDVTANWVQCFNHVEEGYTLPGPNFFPPNYPTDQAPIAQRYYCGYGEPQSDLGSKPEDSCGDGSFSSKKNCTTIPDGQCSYASTPAPGCNQLVKIEICNVNSDESTTSEYYKTHIKGTGGTGEYGSCIPSGYR